MNDIIKVIYETRMREGYNQTEFARMIGISQPYMSKIESGDIEPGLKLIERMMMRLCLKVVPKTKEDY